MWLFSIYWASKPSIHVIGSGSMCLSNLKAKIQNWSIENTNLTWTDPNAQFLLMENFV